MILEIQKLKYFKQLEEVRDIYVQKTHLKELYETKKGQYSSKHSSPEEYS
jgi:hypothetical protein